MQAHLYLTPPASRFVSWHILVLGSSYFMFYRPVFTITILYVSSSSHSPSVESLVATAGSRPQVLQLARRDRRKPAE